ncbi:MAG: ribonuclease III [Candidatus Syntrophonatronum acetioxidans]|uniref:Ribonuclease 3 n=1 Tax=Candidatus Syntrophonatronum acetioxidans TaxID=1795816 RepID=A0A424YBW9_9FIRM|nr:MAG: ribonuclease III [Candidatus Syntrophonatronum acetioxidans]
MDIDKNLQDIEKKIKIEFNNKNLLKQALTHTSYAHEYFKDKCYHNERLEFLGDAVLELIVSEYLYEAFPDLPEGELTRLRANIVCEVSLVKGAKGINLGDYIFLGKGELSMGGRERPSILADAFEALMGALYIDQGYITAKRIALNLLGDVMEELQKGIIYKDYKTMLQEHFQKTSYSTPQYKIIRESGPDHDKIFEAQVMVNDQVLGEGRGKSKKEAEQSAASRAWDRLRNNCLP